MWLPEMAWVISLQQDSDGVVRILADVFHAFTSTRTRRIWDGFGQQPQSLGFQFNAKFIPVSGNIYLQVHSMHGIAKRSWEGLALVN